MVRPYALIGGRTRPAGDALDVIAMIIAVRGTSFDPADLEPERRPGGAPDLRRLAGLLAQPLAALAGSGYGKPVWHC